MSKYEIILKWSAKRLDGIEINNKEIKSDGINLRFIAVLSDFLFFCSVNLKNARKLLIFLTPYVWSLILILEYSPYFFF